MKHTFFSLFFFITIVCQAQFLASSDSFPVRVSYINIEQAPSKTILNWKVVCNLQYANFEVQRSSNGKDYFTISSFTSDRIRCLSPFRITDDKSEGKVFYRLRVGDKDGRYATSKTLVAFGKVKSFEINSITPNLISANALLSISSAETEKAYITITNMQGHFVKQLSVSLNKGTTDINLNLSNLSKGQYIIKVTNSLSDSRTAKVIKL